MNILFLTLVEFESLQASNIYTDLLREFAKNGHSIYVISPVQRRENIDTHVVKEGSTQILRLKIGNIQKTNIIEKGLSTLMIEKQFIRGIECFFSDIEFDLILYSTPPITFVGAVEYVKDKSQAETYLLLKDIFPQNAIDIGLLRKTGIKGLLYKYFKKKERTLYEISDHIGCMSNANVEYLIRHNPEIDPHKVEVCPNCIEIADNNFCKENRSVIREKYHIPVEKKVFVYGGNLGRPQGIPYLIKCLRSVRDINEALFLIIGDGTERYLIEKYLEETRQSNVILMRNLPKNDYDTIVSACDVGMIFLDHRFTIPNFPSRLLSYMQAKLPVFAVTDSVTDIGTTITTGDFGWWCESNDTKLFRKTILAIIEDDLERKGNNAMIALKKNYSSKSAYEIITSHC